MENISSFIKVPEKRQVREGTSEFEYQCLGDEMYRHFGKGTGNKIYPLFSSYRYTHRQIRDAWDTYKKTGKHSFEYFMGILHHTN